METTTLDEVLAAKNEVTDAAYIMAQTSSGETVKISKADLASVVAGLMFPVSFALFEPVTSHGSDIDNLGNGIYNLDITTSDGYTNLPEGTIKYSILINLSVSSAALQVAFIRSKNTCWVRSRVSGIWGEWTQF